jgi:hypothetical protein
MKLYTVRCLDCGSWSAPRRVLAPSALEAAEIVCGGPLTATGLPARLCAEVTGHERGIRVGCYARD